MKRILSLFILFSFVWLAVLPLRAQQAREVFVNMPDSMLTLLTKINRADCIDFLDSKMRAVVENRLGKKSEMTRLTDDYIHMKISELTSWQMKLLALNDTTHVICTVHTVEAPAADSSVKFYTMDWKELQVASFLSLPTDVKAFTQLSDSTQTYAFEEALRAADMLLMNVQVDAVKPQLTVTMTTPDYMSKETAEKLKPFLRRPLLYIWKDGKFTLNTLE